MVDFKPSCPNCDVELEYQEGEEDVGIAECYFCPECDYDIPYFEFHLHMDS